MRSSNGIKKLRINNINRVIIFGGSPLAAVTVDELRKRQIEVVLFSSPRQIDEKMDSKGTTLGDLVKEKNIKYFITEDINSEKKLYDFISKNTLGLGLGEAWSFSKEILDKFEGRLLDFMGIPLPKYRGGAHYSWLILSGEKKWGCCMQVINEDTVQGEFDSGEIVKRKDYLIPHTCRIPQDIFDYACKEDVEFIMEFIEEAVKGKEFILENIKEESSIFFPRLHTLHNGWINWNWEGEAIERFICAFDEPYAGASTMCNGRLIRMKGVSFIEKENKYHPFQSGLVLRVIEEKVFVATTSGILKINMIFDENNKIANNTIKPGVRFFTPIEKIQESLIFQANYDARGLKND